MKNERTKTGDATESNRPAPLKIGDGMLDPELRRRAEEIDGERSALLGGNQGLTSLSPAENFKLFHELQVHQIELELQNEELRRIQSEIQASQSQIFE